MIELNPTRSEQARERIGSRARASRAPLAAVLPILAGLVPWGPLGAAEAARVVGWVDSFDGAAEGYSLKRQGQVIEVYPLMPLVAGDTVLVGTEGGRIRIHVSETEARTIERSESPFPIPDSGRTPTLSANLLEWLGNLLGSTHPGHETTEITLISRGDSEAKPSSGLLYVEAVRLAAGRRPLALAWIGGKPPYSVRLTPENEARAPLAALDGLAEPAALIPEIEIRPGTYRLLIRDAAGNELPTRIQVVSASAVPEPAPGLIPGGLAEAARHTLRAAWLAGQDDGWVWRLEAYQGVVGLGDDSSARMLSLILSQPNEIARF